MPSVKAILSLLRLSALAVQDTTKPCTHGEQSSLSTAADDAFPHLVTSLVPSCPIDGPLSCHNSTAVEDSCCFIYPGGQMLLTQFWDTRPSIGPNNSWTLHGLWYVLFICFIQLLCTARLFHYFVSKSCTPPWPAAFNSAQLHKSRTPTNSHQARPLRRPLRIILHLRTTLPQHHRHPGLSQSIPTPPDNVGVLAAKQRNCGVLLDARVE